MSGCLDCDYIYDSRKKWVFALENGHARCLKKFIEQKFEVTSLYGILNWQKISFPCRSLLLNNQQYCRDLGFLQYMIQNNDQVNFQTFLKANIVMDHTSLHIILSTALRAQNLHLLDQLVSSHIHFLFTWTSSSYCYNYPAHLYYSCGMFDLNNINWLIRNGFPLDFFVLFSIFFDTLANDNNHFAEYLHKRGLFYKTCKNYLHQRPETWEWASERLMIILPLCLPTFHFFQNTATLEQKKHVDSLFQNVFSILGEQHDYHSIHLFRNYGFLLEYTHVCLCEFDQYMEKYKNIMSKRYHFPSVLFDIVLSYLKNKIVH